MDLSKIIMKIYVYHAHMVFFNDGKKCVKFVKEEDGICKME